MRKLTALTCTALLTVLFSVGVARAAGVRQAGSWVAGCSNLRACYAYVFSDELRERGSAKSFAYLVLTRSGDPRAPTDLQIVVPEHRMKPPAFKTRVRVDGRVVEGVGLAWKFYFGFAPACVCTEHSVGTVAPAKTLTLLAALRKGRMIQVEVPGHKPANFSLAGADILSWIDSQQLRDGTPAALWNVGSAPEPLLPAPSAPRIVLPPQESQAGLTDVMPPSVMARVSSVRCVPERELDIFTRLGPGKVLWSPYCGDAAKRLLLLGDEAGEGLASVMLPLPEGYDVREQPLTVMPLKPYIPLDAATGHADWRELQSSPGSNCGRAIRWHWTGSEFVLTGDWLVLQCRGVVEEDEPQLYEVTFQDPTPPAH